MIYATFIVGKEYRDKYISQVQKEIVGKDIHILTDTPELFPDSKIELYTRDVFSYYEKLLFLVRTVLERKERVTFIDCDWIRGLHLDLELEKNTFYTYALFKFEEFENKPFSMEGINMVIDVLEKNKFTLKKDVYIGEAIMSLPYSNNTESILKDLIDLQSDWENKFNQNIITENKKLKRYASYGVGYGEGGALTAVLQKYNTKLQDTSLYNFISKSII